MSKKLVIIGAVAVVALLSVGVGWLFSSGRLVYVSPGSQVAISSAVCGSDVVDTYNAAAYYVKRGNSETPTMDEDGLKKLATDIKAKNNYADDATCQTILFWLAVHNKDAQAADTAYQAVNKLHTKRIFADSNIRSNEPIFMYENYVTGLKPSDSSEGYSD